MPYKAAHRFSLMRKTRAVFFMLIILGGFQLYFYFQKTPELTNFVHYDRILQEQLDSIKALDKKEKFFPFNPNFITDQSGYFLGLSTEEIDRLHSFRAKNKWIRSAQEFQAVTKVSETWLKEFSPYFKFPSFDNKTKEPSLKKVKPIFDLNTVSAEELTFIRGIGAVLSERIIRYRKRIQGFSTLEQLDEVYGLNSELLEEMKQQLSIKSPPQIQKIPIDKASLSELMALTYLTKAEAKKIISFRTQKGAISLMDLERIEGFDATKIKRLALYLY